MKLLNVAPIRYILGEAGFGGRKDFEVRPASLTYYEAQPKKRKTK